MGDEEAVVAALLQKHEHLLRIDLGGISTGEFGAVMTHSPDHPSTPHRREQC